MGHVIFLVVHFLLLIFFLWGLIISIPAYLFWAFYLKPKIQSDKERNRLLKEQNSILRSNDNFKNPLDKHN